ncbi:uncharacterized protein LOC143366050 [Andrena cerasifolii]|uniref:uncharacterized protein LOC143366050 n=1 Tax=Andrena cerasifolii TaxID=2819439 RepID=UPI004037B3B2
MRTLVQLALGLLIAGRASGAVHSEGAKCLEVQCSPFEHCNDYYNQCEPCSSVCDETGNNYQQEVCNGKCQAYVRHMLQGQYAKFRGDLDKMWTLVTIAIATACLSLLGMLWLFAKRLARWNQLHGVFHRAFTSNWMKRTSTTAASNSNNNNSHRNREAQNDAEIGTARQNGLILMMPTISASVAPSRNDSGNVSGNSSGSRSGSGSTTGIANNTPNTTITSLSRRHPSEDTTLDYAYDNPAMTPSPEAVQLRTNRESSF